MMKGAAVMKFFKAMLGAMTIKEALLNNYPKRGKIKDFSRYNVIYF